MTASAILNDGTYHFFSETILPNGRKFLYEKDMAISCNNPTSISIGNIGMEKINGKLPEKFDFVMSWLGGALYPLTVRIDDMGKAEGDSEHRRGERTVCSRGTANNGVL